MNRTKLQLVPANIDPLIIEVRGQKVILDADLARVYGVPTKALNQAIKRNSARFPEDFLFKLTGEEIEGLHRSQIVTGSGLRSQIVTSNERRGGRRYLPYAFTEHGAIMAANILNREAGGTSPRPQRRGWLQRRGVQRRRRHAGRHHGPGIRT
jgi:hypothetical protein